MTRSGWKANLPERCKISPRPTAFSFPTRCLHQHPDEHVGGILLFDAIALDHRFGWEAAIRSSRLNDASARGPVI